MTFMTSMTAFRQNNGEPGAQNNANRNQVNFFTGSNCHTTYMRQVRSTVYFMLASLNGIFLTKRIRSQNGFGNRSALSGNELFTRYY